MPISRYKNTPTLSFGESYGTSTYIQKIRSGINDGSLKYKESVLQGRQRLDIIAGEEYGDSRYWWIIAAASQIGWSLQCPPGTILYIPDLQSVLRLLG